MESGQQPQSDAEIIKQAAIEEAKNRAWHAAQSAALRTGRRLAVRAGAAVASSQAGLWIVIGIIVLILVVIVMFFMSDLLSILFPSSDANSNTEKILAGTTELAEVSGCSDNRCLVEEICENGFGDAVASGFANSSDVARTQELCAEATAAENEK